MENEIAIYVASYAGFRLAILAAFAYGFYLVLRPKMAYARSKSMLTGVRRADQVRDDHC